MLEPELLFKPNLLSEPASGTEPSQANDGDIHDAIFSHIQALELENPPYLDRSSTFNHLAGEYLTRFRQGGQQHDLDEAITLHERALQLRPPPHPLRAGSLNNLASAFLTKFEEGGQQSDLDEAISLHRQGLDLRPPSDPDRSGALNNIGNALLARFKHGGQQDDIEEAIMFHKIGIELRPPLHPDQPNSINNLANTLLTRFWNGGQQSNLDEAISLHRQALDLRDPSHPDRFHSFNNLASALLTRFYQTGQQSDLDESISLHRQALELRHSPHPDRPGSLNNIANALVARFKRGGLQGDIDEAISLHRQALELRPPPHPDRPSSLNNLANALSARFIKGGQPNDLDEAITLYRQALALQAPPHPDRFHSLNNLASALSAKFKQERQESDLYEAMSLYAQALNLRPPRDPSRSQTFNKLGNLYITAASVDGDFEYYENAMTAFSAGMQGLSQPTSQRFLSARRWTYYADQGHHISSMEAYDAALQTLPQLAALSLDIQARQQALTAGSDGLARRAARCAIREGNLDKAVEYLDSGRAIFWSQLLHLRSPFHQLHDVAPELEARLRNTAAALERGSQPDTFVGTLDNRTKMKLEEDGFRLARLDNEWAEAIAEVRKLKGFEDFLRPRRLSSLQAAAAKCPIVILISNDDASHCLIMTSTMVHCIPLKHLPAKKLREFVYLIQAAATRSAISRTSLEEPSKDAPAFPPTVQRALRDWTNTEEERGVVRKRPEMIPSDDIFKSVLKTLWHEVVKPVIDFLGFEKSEVPPLLQWCLTGLFSFLPVHAAGCYDDELAIDCASDYIVSSYTPTIGALLDHNTTPSAEPFKMMVVIQSQELRSTQKELKKIEQYVSDESLVKLGIPGTAASVEAVASRLSDVSIAHFACHGKQNRLKPLDSGLKLDDGILLVSRIMKEPMPNGSLAFLSACETAMGDEKLPDEAMSLAASLLFAGFRRVIATMWEIRDEDGPTVADNFYQEIFRGPDGKCTPQPDVSKSAQALHIAVKKLRSDNVGFRRWVPFIHMGN